MTITEIEEKKIETIEALNLFAVVDSAGRSSIDDLEVLAYPAASIMFLREQDLGIKSRPVAELTFIVFVSTKNLQGEQEAARDAYTLIDAVRDAIHGKTLSIDGIEPFVCASRELSGYQSGIITYTLTFTARQSRPVVSE